MGSGVEGGICAAASFVQHSGTCLGLHPRQWESACLQSMPNDLYLCFGWFCGHDGWVVLVSFQWKSTFATLVKTWPGVSARELVTNKALLCSEIAYFGGVYYCDKVDWVFFVCFFTGISILNWRIFPTNPVIIQSWYIFAVTFSLMNCHFSDEESLIWRLEFLLAQQIGNGSRENCVTRSPKNSTSEARINLNGVRSSKFFRKVFCKYCIYLFISNFPVARQFLYILPRKIN